jgi:small GTP-binding protein
MTLAQKIADIENEMARTQKNKATAHHLGLLKAKLAKLKRELIEGPRGGGGAATPGEGFDVTKSGDARVGLIGFPSVGKSTLLTKVQSRAPLCNNCLKLTGTESKIAEYEFTTLTCIPGVVNFKGSKIQLLDLPGIIEGAKDGRGRGRQVIAVARTCSLIMIVLDAAKPITHKRLIEHELEGFGIRLNKKPADIIIKRKDKGGVTISKMVDLTKMDEDMVCAPPLRPSNTMDRSNRSCTNTRFRMRISPSDATPQRMI